MRSHDPGVSRRKKTDPEPELGAWAPTPASDGRRPGCAPIVALSALLITGHTMFDSNVLAGAHHRAGDARPREPDPDRARRRERWQADAELDDLRDDPRIAHTRVCRAIRAAGIELLEDAAAEVRDSWCDEEDCAAAYVARAAHVCGMDDAERSMEGSSEVEPEVADLRVLRALAAWLRPPRYAPPPPPSAEWAPRLLASTAPACLAPGSTAECAVLDFGCGDADELRAVGGALRTRADLLFGVDVYDDADDDDDREDPEAAGSRGYTRYVLPSPDDGVGAYCDALDALAPQVRAPTAGSAGVAIVVASVTLHHVHDPQTRRCVLAFIANVLEPRGVFLLREWDGGSPAGRLDAWFDLLHAWSPAMAADQLPATPDALRSRGTRYDTWQGYEAQIEAAGLVMNVSLQMETHGETPEAMAEAWPARNFEALFGRRAAPTVLPGGPGADPRAM